MTLHESDLGRLRGDENSLAYSTPKPSLRCRLVLRLARKLAIGELTIELPSGERLVCSGEPGPRAVLQLHRWRPLWRLLLGGDLGFAESYLDGDWSSPDLAAFLNLATQNEARLAGAVRPLAPLRWLARWRHAIRRNTRRGSRRNIAAHHDLGNEFYAHWLDREMNYSSGLYRDPTMSLETAQAAKQARILGFLELTGGMRVLEIGCGWGSLVEAVARQGCAVTGLTLSRAQLDFAEARVGQADLTLTPELKLQDYRDVSGKFDRIVSIEMIEAVGEENWPLYFARLHELLEPGGIAVLQAITIDKSRFAAYRDGVDFIQRYIFPGGMLPTKTTIIDQARRAGLELEAMECFGASYERTLAAWGERFRSAWPDIAEQGFSDRFRLMWRYYLDYCRAGFSAGAIDVGLYRFVRSR